MNLTWGLQDSGVNVFVSCICGFQFKGQLEMPFSIFYFLQSFFCFVIIYVCSAILTPTAYVIFYIGCAALSLIAWGLFHFCFEIIEEDRAEIAKERRTRS